MTWYSFGLLSASRVASSATTTNCSIAPNSSWIAAIDLLYAELGHRIGDEDDGSPTLRPVQKNAHTAITAAVAAKVAIRPLRSSIGVAIDTSIRLKKPRSRRSITSMCGGARE